MEFMNEEEADALDEKLTQTIPKVDFNKPDIFIHQRAFLKSLNPAVVDYIMTRAIETHQTPAQNICELVEQRIAASA